MAIKKYNVLSNENQHVSVPFNYTRGSAMPIDNSTVWPTLSDAQNYANGTTEGYGVPYVGQFLTVNDNTGVSAYVIEDTNGTLKPLATGGDASALEAKLNTEIATRASADTYISNEVSTTQGRVDTLETGATALSGRVDTLETGATALSGRVDTLETGTSGLSTRVTTLETGTDGLSTRVTTLETDYTTLTGTTLPELKTTLSSGLSVDLVKQDTATSGYIATYYLTQGGVQVGAKINIPKDFLVKSATVETCSADNVPEGVVPELKKGDKYIDFVINAKDGVGTEQHLYINLKGLMDIYTGDETTTISVGVGANNKISAVVKPASIDFGHLATGLSTYIADIKTSVTTAGEVLSAYARETSANALSQAKSYTNAVSTDLSTDYDKKIGDARRDLSSYARETSANALTQAESFTTTKISQLSGTIEAGKTSDNAQQIFTKITETAGKLSYEAAQLGITDIWGLSTKIDTAEKHAKDYTDAKLDALDYTASVAATQRVKSITQTNGAISVEAESMTLANIANAKNDLTAMLSDTFDAKGAAAAAETAAKLSAAEVRKDLEAAVTNARTDLSSYARETSANALVDAKKYADETSAYAFGQAKEYTNLVSAGLSSDYDKKIGDAKDELKGASTDLSTAETIAGAKKYADIVANAAKADGNLSAATVRADLTKKIADDISAAKDELKGASTDLSTAETIAGAKTYADVIATAKANAAQAAGELSAATVRAGLTGYVKYDDVLGGKDVISATNKIVTQKDIAALTGVMHFKGVATNHELSTGSKVVPVPPYSSATDTPVQGDFVIDKVGSEFVWANSQWYKVGDETLYAKQADLDTEINTRAAADTFISGKVDELSGKVNTISTDLNTVSGDLNTEIANRKSADSYISGKVDDEVTDRSAADTYISGKVDAKIKVGVNGAELSNAETLSVVRISDEDYYQLVAEEKNNPSVLYVVSSDYVNGHDQRVINVGSALSATDAVNLSGMNAAIQAAVAEVVKNQLSSIKINDLEFTIDNTTHTASLSIEEINCGGAK